MKILYITKGDHIDYQNDCLLIGLKELYGPNVIDYNKQIHNYISYNERDTKLLYGKGMTVSRVLPDLEVDRDDITTKIKNKYFDYIIYGSIWRCSEYLEKILQYYPKNKVIAIDGEDNTNIHHFFDLGIPYFKRELIYKHERIFPISFAFPTSKVKLNKVKTKNFSHITPFDRKTYIYNNELDYYNDYQEARFGITIKKAGWDCMRHWEILGNGCIPYFVDIEKCPEQTLHNFPKTLCVQINKDLLTKCPSEVYESYHNKIFQHFLKNNTTTALANYVISIIQKV